MSENKETIENEEKVIVEDQTQEECENKECGSTESVEVNEEYSLEEKVAKLEEELKNSEEKFLRVHADFENIKKRLEREKYAAIDYASEKFAKDLLAPIDTLEMALMSANADLPAEELLGKLKEGIELTIKNFNSTFEKHNITPVETDGEFDPNVHNAIMQVASEEHDNGAIVQVMQKGYMLKDRLIRPAMVSICQK